METLSVRIGQRMPSRKTKEATRRSLVADGPASLGASSRPPCLGASSRPACLGASSRLACLSASFRHAYVSVSSSQTAAVSECLPCISLQPTCSTSCCSSFLPSSRTTFPTSSYLSWGRAGVRVKSNGRGVAPAYLLCKPCRPPSLYPLPLNNTPLTPYVCLWNVQRSLRKALQDAYFYIS